jgi:glycosyltransferase domain-containing protein
MQEQLTLIIPTKDRWKFLRRALSYYANVGCPFTMLICDSSTGSQLQRNIETVSGLRAKLKIEHVISELVPALFRRASGWQEDELLKDIMDYVKTPYVAFFADDDFCIVRNLELGVRFLEENSDYSYVCGTACIFGLDVDSENVTGKIKWLGPYRQCKVVGKSAGGRIEELMSEYSVLEYGISRTHQMKVRWKTVFEAGIDNLSAELLNCSLVVIQGKAHKLDELLLVRQGHNGQISSKTGILKFYEDFFGHAFQRIIEILAPEVAKIDCCSSKEAAVLIKKSYREYLARGLARKGSINTFPHRENVFRKKLKEIPGARGFVLKLRAFRDAALLPRDYIGLPSFLRPSSVYYDDFSEVLKVVEDENI